MKVIRLTEEECELLILCLGMATAVAYREGMTQMRDKILEMYTEKIKDAHGTDETR